MCVALAQFCILFFKSILTKLRKDVVKGLHYMFHMEMGRNTIGIRTGHVWINVEDPLITDVPWV